MDNLTVTPVVPGARWILQGLERLMTWARMCFKPTKSLVLKRGKITAAYGPFPTLVMTCQGSIELGALVPINSPISSTLLLYSIYTC